MTDTQSEHPWCNGALCDECGPDGCPSSINWQLRAMRDHPQLAAELLAACRANIVPIMPDGSAATAVFVFPNGLETWVAAGIQKRLHELEQRLDEAVWNDLHAEARASAATDQTDRE